MLIPAGGLIRSSEFALALGASREGWSAECDEIAGAVVADSWVAWVRWPPELFQAFWQIAATMRIIEHDPQPDRDCPRLESLVRAGRSHLHPSDGPEAPRFFWWRGKRLELRLEPRCWDLLVYLWPESGGWPKSDGPRDRVPISEIGRAVYGKRSVEYNRIKPDLSDLNTALADQSIGVTWAKVRGQKHLELQRSI
ncbi:MAG: hypothetical protein A2W31_04450 [Planctomycetes bacterium RBG_16_64_10]|nr:MAG: hypothetical protein A2W31_04450 [Planctomycetes bacterium RBG_16_64_10]